MIKLDLRPSYASLTAGTLFPLELAFIEFACYDASCRPPTSGGTGGTNSRRTGHGVRVRQPGVEATGKGDTGHSQSWGALSDKQKQAVISGFITGFPHAKKVLAEAGAESLDEQGAALVSWMTKNANDLAEQSGFMTNGRLSDVAVNASHWYPVAHDFNNRVAAELGIPAEAMHATTAIFSAGTDWGVNVPNAVHAARVCAENPIVSLKDVERTYLDRMGTVKYILASKTKKEVAKAPARAELQRMEDLGPEKWAESIGLKVGKRLMDAPDGAVGRFVKAHEKVGLDGGPLRYIEFNVKSGGTYTTRMTTQLAMSARDPLQEHAKAVSVLRAALGGATGPQLRSVISVALGGGAKVRSFFNNMADPHDIKHSSVTIDTHAAGSLLGIPVPNSHPFIKDGIFTPKASIGMPAMYPLMREVFVAWGREQGLTPRAAQSVLWEAQRRVWNTNGASKERSWKEIEAAMSESDAAVDSIHKAVWKAHKTHFKTTDPRSPAEGFDSPTGFIPNGGTYDD